MGLAGENGVGKTNFCQYTLEDVLLFDTMTATAFFGFGIDSQMLVKVKSDSVEVQGLSDARSMTMRLGIKGVAESDSRKIPKSDYWYRIKFNCDRGRIFDILHAMKDVEIVA